MDDLIGEERSTTTNSRNVAGTLLRLLGILCMLAAIGLTVYNWWDSERAGKISDEIVDVFKEKMDPVRESDDDPEMSGNDEEARYREMPVLVIDGYEYIGLLEIPSLSILLPVMAEWDYDRLKIAPCRYSGSYFTNDLVICAHNYVRHFNPVRTISMGADVYFTNPKGLKLHYVADNIQTIQPTSVEEMVDNSIDGAPGERQWDLTLFTCNLGGATRCAVRCHRVDR